MVLALAITSRGSRRLIFVTSMCLLFYMNKKDREAIEVTESQSPASVFSEEASQLTPFLSLSWEHWQQTREQVARCLERFASAAEEQRPDKVLSVGMEMQEIVSRIYLEAYVMSADLELKELPR